MPIEVHYCSKSHRVKKEKAKDSDLFFECVDGVHTITSDSVFTCEGKKPLVLLFDGVVSPFGANSSKSHIQGLLATVTVGKQTGKEVGYSSRFMRNFKTLMNYLPRLMFFAFIVYVLIIMGLDYMRTNPYF